MKKTLFPRNLVTIFLALATSAILTSFISAQAPKQESLLNGLKILMWSNPSADKVAVRLRIHSGSAFDPQGREGVMQMLADNLFPTTASREYFADDLGGSLDVKANYDYIEIDAAARPDAFLTVLDHLSSAVTNTPIDKETTSQLRESLLARIKERDANAASVADVLAANKLYGNYPYGRPQLGTQASVSKIVFADLLDARTRFLTADNATMTISGNFDQTLAMRSVKRYFGSWLKADKKVPATFRQPDATDTKEFKMSWPGLDATYQTWARRVSGRTGKDYGAAEIFSFIKAEFRCHAPSSHYEPYLLAGLWLDRSDVKSDPEVTSTIYSGPCPDAGLHDTPANRYSEFLKQIGNNEISSAKSYLVRKANEPGALERRWLDVDTYGLASSDDEITRLNNTTLDDVRDFVHRLDGSSAVSVIVASPPK